MTWTDDKSKLLSRIVDLYHEIDDSDNRYAACQAIFKEMDFFLDILTENDEVIKSLINIDREYVETYLETMSSLMGEEL